MKFTVEYFEFLSDTELETHKETFNINERRPEPYVFKSEIMKAIKASHPNIHNIQIFGCDINVWNDD